jgi:hypothetical protein
MLRKAAELGCVGALAPEYPSDEFEHQSACTICTLYKRCQYGLRNAVTSDIPECVRNKILNG